MATVTTTVTKRTCDIFKTTRDVKKYEVIVREKCDDGADGEVFIEKILDLGERAKDRLISYVQRGITRPSDKQK